MMIMGNHSSMMNMLKDNPGMMQNMMSVMMENYDGKPANDGYDA